MARGDEQAIKDRRLAREAAAKTRDDAFIEDKLRTHAQAVAKIARLREQRLAEASKEAVAPRKSAGRAGKASAANPRKA
jgi:hypothetical protein